MKTGPFVGEKGPTPQPRARLWIFCLPAPRLGVRSLNTWVDPNGKRPDILSALVANVRPTRSHPVPAPLADDAHHSQPPFLLGFQTQLGFTDSRPASTAPQAIRSGSANSRLSANPGLCEGQAVGNVGGFCALAKVLLSFVFVFTVLSRCSAQLSPDAPP